MTIDLDEPWVEIYRPRNFDDIVSQNLAINNIKKFVESGNMPHMIFTGPAGTGKTSTALIIAKYLLKGENYHQNLLELNASDSRRMADIRNILKVFTNQASFSNENPLKIVIMDEADNLRGDAQQALRRIIEKTSDRVKFIILCNYIDRIIDPIISRCAVFRFVNLSEAKIVERLKYISLKVGLKIPKEKADIFFSTLYFISGGDLRKAINSLQMSVALELIGNLDINEIYRISGFLDESTFAELIKSLKGLNFNKSVEILEQMEYFDSRNFIRQLLKELPNLGVKKSGLTELYSLIGDVDYRISQGADGVIQISAILAQIIQSMNDKNELNP